MDDRQRALVDLGLLLRERGYAFVTPAPAAHEIVNRRPGNERGRSLADVFGWSRPFAPEDLPREAVRLMEAAGVLDAADGLARSTVRYSSLGPLLVAHSAFPTTARDAVFFGPDTYRTCRAIRGEFRAAPEFAPEMLVDIGAGAGAVGLYAASLLPGRPRAILTDISAAALRMCAVNARLNGFETVELREGDALSAVPEPAQLYLCNPPFIADPDARLYRDGGGDWGIDIGARIVAETLARLPPGGRLMLFTGAPVVDGRDVFRGRVAALLERPDLCHDYGEVDPDIFCEELLHPPYDRADRIAAIFLAVTRRAAA
jgi:precorrin-6B methylase 2